jgi:hypothetical protein
MRDLSWECGPWEVSIYRRGSLPCLCREIRLCSRHFSNPSALILGVMAFACCPGLSTFSSALCCRFGEKILEALGGVKMQIDQPTLVLSLKAPPEKFKQCELDIILEHRFVRWIDPSDDRSGEMDWTFGPGSSPSWAPRLLEHRESQFDGTGGGLPRMGSVWKSRNLSLLRSGDLG